MRAMVLAASRSLLREVDLPVPTPGPEQVLVRVQALMFLEKVTSIPGFVARSIVAPAQPKPDHGE